MKRKALSIILVLVMLLSIIPTFQLSAAAESAPSDMDALSALGIDSGAAPDGYDENSMDNPYGRNIMELAPVYELYKIGLTNGVGYDNSYNTTSGSMQNGSEIVDHTTTNTSNSLQSTLYGHETLNETTVSSILSKGTNKIVGNGTTISKGKYTLVTSGTVDGGDTSFSTNAYLKEATTASTNLGEEFNFALSSVVSGNFDGNAGGLASQTAMVYTADYSANGGLYLRFGNATDGNYGSNAKTLLSKNKDIGNPLLTYDDKLVEDFAENPYQLQNYLQVATGDWNNDGFDEVAVFIPEKGNSRIVVYALQLTSSDDKATAYLNPAKWETVWTYYLYEGDVVSNMVSLVSGDVNQDGTDDLAATWGYYYGPKQNIGSTAVVMFGANGTELLKKSQQFNLTYGASNIVRASFEFGDMAGSNSNELILCGQSDADLIEGNTNTRYVALYSWDGTKFTSSMYKNFNLFEKKDGNYIWDAMSSHNDKFYSLPLCTSNTAIISQGISGGGDLLYFDSLIIEYGEKGLKIKEAWDNTLAMQKNTGPKTEYVEYGAVAGDLTGQTGAAAIFTMSQTLSSVVEKTATYNVTGTHTEPAYTWEHYFKSWFHKIFNIRTNYLKFTGWQEVTESKAVSIPYGQLIMGQAYMTAVDPTAGTGYISRSPVDYSTAICLAKTDNDSSYMSYSGRHYYTYTDPEVLAVLASPPYFSDLLDRDDLSGNYAESTTTYSKTKGSGSGTNISSTITLGAYVSYEQDIKVFGVTIASVEAEAQVTAGFTWDWSEESTLEQTVTYSASSGEDMVSFYSIPMEIYEYTSFVPDGKGDYKTVLTTVNIPHEAAVRLLSLDEYESIQKDYGVLPKIADSVLTHTIGDPSTYPTSLAGYNVIASYTGESPSAVGFSSTSGGSAIAQEIVMSSSNSTSFSSSVAVEAKAGAGAGGFKVGIIAGAELGAGFVKISTSGSSFSGEMQAMPIEAQPYGYGMNWRIFCYKYKSGRTSFPVVSYVVSDVNSPAPLPADFAQDMAKTDEASVTLTWTYDKAVSGFKIYRYYEFPEGSGSYELAFLPFTKADTYDSETGIYSFSYKDTGLSPYTEYKYQIKTVRAEDPKESIYSEPMSCRTKTIVGYPNITLVGLVDGQLPIYPDANSTITASVASESDYTGLGYQWQKQLDGEWNNIPGSVSETLKISNAGVADKGIYRCRINCIYYDTGAAQNYYISAFSPTFATAYAKRTPTASVFKAEEHITTLPGGDTLDGLTANIELHSDNLNHSTAPTGNVVFSVKGTDYEYSQTVALVPSPGTKAFGTAPNVAYKYFATASMSISSLPDGVYTVNAYYSGNRVFKDMETTSEVFVVVGDASAYRMNLAAEDAGGSVTKFEYGENIWPSLYSVSKQVDGSIIKVTQTASKYEILAKDASPDTEFITFTRGSATPNVGSYTLRAYVGDDVVAVADFTVGQKAITISVQNKPNVDAGASVMENPPVIESADITNVELESLQLTYSVANSAGNTSELNNTTEPGNYNVTACISETTPADLYNNYSITYVSGIYTIIGATYRLKALAEKYTNEGIERPVGTVGISNIVSLQADYASGTAILLYATPQPGYQVNTWTAKFADKTEEEQVGGNTFSMKTQAQTCDVTVTFKPAVITLSTIIQPEAGGTITCSDELFSSPAYVSYGAEYEFTATPVVGYHFKEWQTVAPGNLTITYAGTACENGANELNISIGGTSTTVYAYFERDVYTLTLSGDITAFYMYDHDGLSTTPQIQKKLSSGDLVPGDTEVTVVPKTGYQAAEDEYFIVNDIVTEDSETHSFSIDQNTVVSLDTTRNVYSVNVVAENGSVTTKVDGIEASTDDLSVVQGGSALIFTAKADRGYVFDHWVLNETPVTNSTQTYTLSELGSDVTMEAVFAENTPYTASAETQPSSRGTMQYTLRDIYGEIVGESKTLMPDTGLIVYKGESIVLSVANNSGSMIEQWKVNNINTFTTQKTYTINNVGGNIEAVAILKAASKYFVNFIAMGETGSVLTASADGAVIDTNVLQYGGSTLEFSAYPKAGYMLENWTITSGGLTEKESSAAVDSDGITMLEPVFIIDPLKQTLTVRAHFTPLVKNTITLPIDETRGVSTITYITPINPSDDGTCSITSGEVRSGGTVIMTFEPKIGYGTDIELLRDFVEAEVNADAVVFVEENADVYNVTVKNLTKTLTMVDSEIYYQLYNITVPEQVESSAISAKAGDTVTLTVTPVYGYLLTELSVSETILNEEFSTSRLVYTFIMPESEVNVVAMFKAIPIVAPIGNGGADKQTIPVTGVGSGIKVSAIIRDGIAELDMDENTLGELTSFSGTLLFDLSKVEGVSSVVIPSQAFASILKANDINGLTISLPDAELNFDVAAIDSIGVYSRDSVTFSAAYIDNGKLTSEQQALVGDRQVIDLSLKVGNEIVSDFGIGTVEVKVPYTLKPGESNDSVVVWYLNDENILEPVTGRYEDTTGCVVFTTNHFSEYVLASLPFTDVNRDDWFFDNVSFAYANGLFSGTTDTTFDPRVTMTRGMLMTVLWRMEGEPDLASVANSSMHFSDVATDIWYTKAVCWASENDIVSGYGDGRFGPNDKLTREQMAVILMNYAKYKVLDVTAAESLTTFTDGGSVSGWAKPAMQWAVSEGLISGVGESLLDPSGNASRCQVATVLQRFMNSIKE